MVFGKEGSFFAFEGAQQRKRKRDDFGMSAGYRVALV
jgi:hypothetical protein